MSGIFIRHGLIIPETELEESFIQSSGPGGQNVNKVASAVQLRFNTAKLAPDLRARLLALAGHRATKDGIIVITARSSRDQQKNRAEARNRLFDLIRRAAYVPKKRKATKPTRASKERRLEKKKVHARLKQT